MFYKIVLILLLAVGLTSCQFTESMVLNEDGSGTISMEMNFSEMMAISGEFDKDSTLVKMDTIVAFRDFLVEKKDSIASLSKAEQARLKKLENYKFRTVVDPETNEMLFDVFTNFSTVEEANELMNAMENSGAFLQGTGDGVKVNNDEESAGLIGVKYSFKRGKFVRDAYIRDKEKHNVQMDSMKQAEAFMSSVMYKLKYTFPKRIKKVSAKDASFSLDGKTLELERSMVEYMKDPDILDLQVELEN